MSVTVKHLNADSSFLLIFSPAPHPTPSDLLAANGAYSILIDPWFVGSSVVNAPWFAITNRVIPSAIRHVSEIDEPDVVLVSQNKPDHCHKETLLQLRPEGKTIIAAEPGAAKAIKTWNHFDPNRVHGLQKYDAKARFGNTFRLHIPPRGPDGLAGEINIAFIPAKNYMTGLHNAFGVTYLPPTSVKALSPVSTIDLPRTRYFHLPRTPLSGPTISTPASTGSSFIRPNSISSRFRVDTEVLQVPDISLGRPSRQSRSSYANSSDLTSSVRPSRDEKDLCCECPADATGLPDFNFDSADPLDSFDFASSLPTPPQSPESESSRSSFHARSTSNFPSASSVSSLSLPQAPDLRYSKMPNITPARPKVLSILYTPHGIALSDLKSYVRNHLLPLSGALPLTLLLHSFDFTQNPWFLGGNIMKGAAGGVEIAKALMARAWISAHDEEKDDRGMAVKLLKTERTQVEEIRRQLLAGEHAKTGWVCDVRNLDVGKEIHLSSESRDLCGAKEGLAVMGLSETTGFPFRTDVAG